MARALVTIYVTLHGSWNWGLPFWCWLTRGESGSTSIRNVGLVIGAIVALALTVRRITVADRQAETARQGLLYDRYQQGAEMLGSPLLAVRLGGIYALQQLAEEYPEQFLRQILRQYCAFVRNPFEADDGRPGGEDGTTRSDSGPPGEDVNEVMLAIFVLDNNPKTKMVLAGQQLNLSGANLAGVYLPNTNLGGAILMDAHLAGAELTGTNLAGAGLWGADLRDADLRDADLRDADLRDADLRDADLTGATLVGADFRSAKLASAKLHDASLRMANLAGADLHHADLAGANLVDADLHDADLTEANLTGANLVGADLAEANLGQANLTGVYVQGSELDGAAPPGGDESGAGDQTKPPRSSAC